MFISFVENICGEVLKDQIYRGRLTQLVSTYLDFRFLHEKIFFI